MTSREFEGVVELLLDNVAHEATEDVVRRGRGGARRVQQFRAGELHEVWRDEVLRRLEQVRRGEVRLERWSDVKRQVEATLERRRGR